MLGLYTSVGRPVCGMQYVYMVVWCVVCACMCVCVCMYNVRLCVYSVCSFRTASWTAASFGIFYGSFGRKNGRASAYDAFALALLLLSSNTL